MNCQLLPVLLGEWGDWIPASSIPGPLISSIFSEFIEFSAIEMYRQHGQFAENTFYIQITILWGSSATTTNTPPPLHTPVQ